MTPKDVFDISADVRDVFVRTGIFAADGNWADPMPPEAIARAVAEVEHVCVTRGMTVPPNVDKLIQAAPFLLPLVGLR